MNIIYLGIGVALLLIILIWIVVRIIKKRSKKLKGIENIPEEVLDDFNYAEERMKGGIYEDGNTDPYSILWEVTKRNRVRESSKSNAGIHPTTTGAELPKQFRGQQSIPSRVNSNDSTDRTEPRESKGNSNPNFWSKFRKQ